MWNTDAEHGQYVTRFKQKVSESAAAHSIALYPLIYCARRTLCVFNYHNVFYDQNQSLYASSFVCSRNVLEQIYMSVLFTAFFNGLSHCFFFFLYRIIIPSVPTPVIIHLPTLTSITTLHFGPTVFLDVPIIIVRGLSDEKRPTRILLNGTRSGG